MVGVSPDTTVREAARKMLDVEVQRLLVIEDGVLQGILTATDVVRAVAEDNV